MAASPRRSRTVALVCGAVSAALTGGTAYAATNWITARLAPPGPASGSSVLDAVRMGASAPLACAGRYFALPALVGVTATAVGPGRSASTDTWVR